jgi:hypothetical protein
MKFTLGEVYGLTRDLQKITSKELPIKASFRLCKFLQLCSSEMEILEKSRIKLIDKYSDVSEDNQKKQVSEENKAKFQEEFSTLLIEEVEIDFTPIPIGDLGDITISANDLVSMQKIFIEN